MRSRDGERRSCSGEKNCGNHPGNGQSGNGHLVPEKKTHIEIESRFEEQTRQNDREQQIACESRRSHRAQRADDHARDNKDRGVGDFSLRAVIAAAVATENRITSVVSIVMGQCSISLIPRRDSRIAASMMPTML